MLYFSHCITHIFLLLVSAAISLSLNLSFILTQTFPPWDGVSDSAVVLIANSNMSPASASLSTPSHLSRARTNRTGELSRPAQALAIPVSQRTTHLCDSIYVKFPD